MTTKAQKRIMAMRAARAEQQHTDLDAISNAPNLEAAIAATLTAYAHTGAAAPVGGGFAIPARAADAAAFITAALNRTGWTTTP